MAEETEEGYSVRWRIEELAKTIAAQFTGIVAQLDKIESKIDEKASNARVLDLENRFEGLTHRVSDLEIGRAGTVAIGKAAMWFIGTVGVAVFLAAVTLLAAAISGRHL